MPFKLIRTRINQDALMGKKMHKNRVKIHREERCIITMTPFGEKFLKFLGICHPVSVLSVRIDTSRHANARVSSINNLARPLSVRISKKKKGEVKADVVPEYGCNESSSTLAALDRSFINIHATRLDPQTRVPTFTSRLIYPRSLVTLPGSYFETSFLRRRLSFIITGKLDFLGSGGGGLDRTRNFSAEIFHSRSRTFIEFNFDEIIITRPRCKSYYSSSLENLLPLGSFGIC